MPNASPHIRVACHVRSSSLVAPVDSTVRRLDHLEADGVIDEFRLDAWPAEVQLGDMRPHGDVVRLFERFETWAAQCNVSICPPFAIETRHSTITGETCQVLHTPVQCVAVYVNGVLMEVFPHSTNPDGDGETYSVRDALALLETHGRPPVGPSHVATPPSRRTVTGESSYGAVVCPRCETEFVSGQGLYACLDCDWVGTATTGRGLDTITDTHEILTRPRSPTRDENHTPKRPLRVESDTCLGS